MNMNDAIGMTRKILNRQMPSDDEITAWIGHAEATVRGIIREELRSRTERLTWDGATIREIVREEIENDKFVAMTEKAQRDCYEQTKPKWLDDEMLAKITDAPKPKTDLEWAAEVCKDKCDDNKRKVSTDGYWSGYRAACLDCAGHIGSLKPSPDWRKIADELAESLRGICKLADPYGGWAGALKAYDEAVKGADQ